MAQVSEKTILQVTNSSHIVKYLFLAELKRLDDVLLKLIEDNEQLQGVYGTAGFSYLGEFYISKKANRIPGYGEQVQLHPQLYDRMQKYNEQSARLLTECTMVNQMVFRLVTGCTTRQEVRDALPECLVAQDAEFTKLERTRPPAYTLDKDERALRQYHKVLPLIEYYAGSHLLY